MAMAAPRTRGFLPRYPVIMGILALSVTWGLLLSPASALEPLDGDPVFIGSSGAASVATAAQAAAAGATTAAQAGGASAATRVTWNSASAITTETASATATATTTKSKKQRTRAGVAQRLRVPVEREREQIMMDSLTGPELGSGGRGPSSRGASGSSCGCCCGGSRC